MYTRSVATTTLAEETFAAISSRLLREPDVDAGKVFASPGLRVSGKIFAMLSRGSLVVKLPAERCAELVAAGARPFESGGRRMREWVTIAEERHADWPALAVEALGFVRASA
jgi:TfoX/Sxy family transcriptional regulator of competence genes